MSKTEKLPVPTDEELKEIFKKVNELLDSKQEAQVEIEACRVKVVAENARIYELDRKIQQLLRPES